MIKHILDTFCSHFIACLVAWLSADPLSSTSHCWIWRFKSRAIFKYGSNMMRNVARMSVWANTNAYVRKPVERFANEQEMEKVHTSNSIKPARFGFSFCRTEVRLWPHIGAPWWVPNWERRRCMRRSKEGRWRERWRVRQVLPLS